MDVEKSFKRYEELLEFPKERDGGAQLYYRTKETLEDEHLRGYEKGQIFVRYLKSWRNNNYQLHVDQTEYSMLFDGSSFARTAFGKHSSRYLANNYMTAGFNLKSSIITGLYLEDVILLYIDFGRATIKDCTFKNCHFEYCDFSRVTLLNVEFANSKFVKSNLQGVNFQLPQKQSISFSSCDLRNVKFKSNGNYEFNIGHISVCNDQSLATLHASYSKRANTFNGYCNSLQNICNKAILDKWKEVSEHGESTPKILRNIVQKLCDGDEAYTYASLGIIPKKMNTSGDEGNIHAHNARLRLRQLIENGGANRESVLDAMANGVNINLGFDKGNHRWHFLNLAIELDNFEVAAELIAKGANVNKLDEGRAPIHRVVEKQELAMLKILLTSSAIKVNKQDSRGMAALQIAVSKNFLEGIALLQERSAIVQLCSKGVSNFCAQ